MFVPLGDVRIENSNAVSSVFPSARRLQVARDKGVGGRLMVLESRAACCNGLSQRACACCVRACEVTVQSLSARVWLVPRVCVCVCAACVKPSIALS